MNERARGRRGVLSGGMATMLVLAVDCCTEAYLVRDGAGCEPAARSTPGTSGWLTFCQPTATRPDTETRSQ